MPASRAHRRPLRVDISPILDSYTSPLASSSKGQEWGLASPSLWDSLLSRSSAARASHSARTNGHNVEQSHLGVVVEWPEDRRLPTKGKRKTLVIWVKPSDDVREQSKGDMELLVPAHLFPSFSAPPLAALLHLHEPIGLSLVVLQPVVSSTSTQSYQSDIDDLDLQLFYSSTDPIMPNGTANGHVSHTTRPARILRQGDTINIPRKNGPSTMRILTSDPVQQGVLTPSTRIIVTSTTHIMEPESRWVDIDGTMSESSHGKTHLSMADFDPDAFLSSSLDLRFSQPVALPDGSPVTESYDLADSAYSSTSGSITPRPNGYHFTAPSSPPAQAQEILGGEEETEEIGTKFSVMTAAGPSRVAKWKKESSREDDVCWMGVGGLGRAGIFEGDWVLLRSNSYDTGSSATRLVRALAWERLDEENEDLPDNPIMITASLHRALSSQVGATAHEIYVMPTSFGARQPTLPIAKTMTLARVATSEGMDKRYERSWLKGLQDAFASDTGNIKEGVDSRLIKRGDIIPVPVWIDKPLEADEGPDSETDTDSDGEESGWTIRSTRKQATSLVYFIVTGLSYDPLNSLDEDFRSSVSSKARSGELGCWVDVGKDGSTRMVLNGIERFRVSQRVGERMWHNLVVPDLPFNQTASTRLRNLLSSCFANVSLASALQLSILVKGARGGGKTSLVMSIADELGFNVVIVDAFDIIGDSPQHTEGSILAALDKAKACSPSILLIKHIEILSKKSESGPMGRPPPIVKVLEDVLTALRDASAESGWPSVLIGTTSDVDATSGEILSCFKQEIEIGAPNEAERSAIAGTALASITLNPDVSQGMISAQSAALQANDIVSLIHRAEDTSLERVLKATKRDPIQLRLAGLALSAVDIEKALGDARASYSDSIGAPKIPNVRWEDVGGLADVKKEILETVQLPLERPELFVEGLKKRSGILLYGPPGTGKTLLAKAVATSCSLNFFSVKGPELLNMYIGESEANVRRVFQRARDASPCIIFMDELDSVAPKRGNQGDSGGVMDRIVSQLLAELDGMSKSGGGDVFVMGATNRPDLLDPALLRPGRFDRMLYLSVAKTNQAQQSILEALTRKFKLDEDLDLGEIAEACPFNYTGADFYALCSDAMLRAMTRKAEQVDKRIEALNALPPPREFPHPLTPQYYLASMATPEEIEVRVGREDFMESLEKLVPSVSREEMEHYKRVQGQFKGFEIGAKET